MHCVTDKIRTMQILRIRPQIQICNFSIEPTHSLATCASQSVTTLPYSLSRNMPFVTVTDAVPHVVVHRAWRVEYSNVKAPTCEFCGCATFAIRTKNHSRMRYTCGQLRSSTLLAYGPLPLHEQLIKIHRALLLN